MFNYDLYLTIRPLFAKFGRENGQPVVRNTKLSESILSNGKPTNFSNLSRAKKDSIIIMFHHDKKLNCLWNNPLKYVHKFQKCLAVLTPDYTIQEGMDLEMIRMNTYRNRWLGCTWQQYGVEVIVTVSWSTPESYDICFSGITYGAIVAVSTIGCLKGDKKKIFLDGYRELIKRKNPSLILVYGSIIRGMSGRILPICYTDGFSNKKEYTWFPLFNLSKIITLKDDEEYGR